MQPGRWSSFPSALGRNARLLRAQAFRTHKRSLATAANLESSPKAGDQLHGFTVQRTQHVPELDITALHLQHDKTGAQYLHLARDDKNNAFSIGFKTNPPDDTGVPHILEHTTLCGSEKFPVRDPFFKMLPRSLSNFMNAFTSSDHTFYPFATTNEQDFRNLLSVYLDATLHPLLNKHDFTQEGWRIGPENPEALLGDASQATEQDKKLVFKGVVYNEMKGQVSDASYLYYIKFLDHIFPSINNSGGDPQKMTDLTYDGLKQFHARNYHPSNARIYTYGNIPVQHHLLELNQRLKAFQKISPDAELKLPIDIETPLSVTVPGPLDPLQDKDKQIKTSLAWTMGDSSDVVESFALSMIEKALISGYGSPLYRSLIESGLGTGFSPNTGYDGSAKTGVFAVGLTGVKKDDVAKVAATIHKTLREVREQGFDRGKIDGEIHQLELGLKHKGANMGTGIMQQLVGRWFNGSNPFEMLQINATVDEFRSRLEKGPYLENLLDKYLLNQRTLEFTMIPAETYAEDVAAEERNRLAQKIADAVTQAGSEAKAIEQLTTQELELLSAQGQKQDLNCLPSVHVADIPRQMERKPVLDTNMGSVKVQWRQAPTNGLTYFRAIHELKDLPDELRLLVPLFNDAIKRIGTKDKTMEELEDLMKLKTGGVDSGYYSTASPNDFHSVAEGFSFSGYAMDANVPAMYELLRTLIHETNFDSPKAEAMIRELIQGEAAGALDSVASAGHAYARRYAESGLSRVAFFGEQIGGITHVKHISRLAALSEDGGLKDVIAKLKTIQKLVISNSSNLRVALTCGPEAARVNEAALQRFLQHLPSDSVSSVGKLTSTTGSADSSLHRDSKTFFPLPYQVYYSALALPTVPYTHAKGPALQILAQLLTHKHLHQEIREKGGAYGGGAYSKSLSGMFGFYSYRDPNPQNTLRIIQNAGNFAVNKDWTQQELEEAKLSVFQGIDAPESINEEGMTKFLYGVDENMEQKKRELLLDVNANDVKEVAQKYLVEQAGNARLAVLGEQRDWANEKDGWTIKTMDA